MVLIGTPNGLRTTPQPQPSPPTPQCPLNKCFSSNKPLFHVTTADQNQSTWWADSKVLLDPGHLSATFKWRTSRATPLSQARFDSAWAILCLHARHRWQRQAARACGVSRGQVYCSFVVDAFKQWPTDMIDFHVYFSNLNLNILCVTCPIKNRGSGVRSYWSDTNVKLFKKYSSISCK